MKRLLLSILTIGLVSVGAFAATRAYFSDQETILGNTITTGSVDIDLYGNSVYEAPFILQNILPGVTTPWQELKIKNVGTAAVVNTIAAQFADGYPDLWNNMKVEVRANSTGGLLIYNGPLYGLNHTASVQLAPSAEHLYYMRFTLDQNFATQGLWTTFNIVVTGNQAI